MTSIDNTHDLLLRLEPTDAYLARIAAAGYPVQTIGPFRAILNPDPNDPTGEEAVPVGAPVSESDLAEGVRELKRFFRDRGTSLTVEFNEPLWPRLPEILKKAGFAEGEREPLLLCTPESFRPVFNPDVTVRYLQPDDPDEDLIAYSHIFSGVLLDGSWKPTPDAIARIRREVERVTGRGHALAILDGLPVGTGFISSTGGVGEINRVATLPVARRRGVAATLTSFMMRDRFNSGDEVIWLSASGVEAQELYLKLGYRLVGEKRYYTM